MHTSLSKSTYPVNCDLCDDMTENLKDLKKRMKDIGINLNPGNYEALTFEDLKTHLFTCEINECGKCKIKGETIKEVKNHIESEHAEDKTTFFGFPSTYHTKTLLKYRVSCMGEKSRRPTQEMVRQKLVHQELLL
jgi:hypothetical protein